MGDASHCLLEIMLSDELLTVGMLTLPVGAQSNWETHNGDEGLTVLSGSLIVQVEVEAASGEVSRTSHEVSAGEHMLIPEDTRHQYFNFTDQPTSFLLAVAPGCVARA